MVNNADPSRKRKRIHIPVPARPARGTVGSSASDKDDPTAGEAQPASHSAESAPAVGTPACNGSIPAGLDISSRLPDQEQKKDGESRQLIFDLAAGELPSVLQFISADKRTGKLDMAVPGQPESGCVCFKNGEIYLAKFRNYEGVEALARGVNEDHLRAVFTYDVTAEGKNVNTPISLLLLGAFVRADELAAEKAPEPAAEKAPEPVAAKLAEPVAEKAPEPAAEKAPEPVAAKLAEPAAEEKQGNDSSASKTGLSIHHRGEHSGSSSPKKPVAVPPKRVRVPPKMVPPNQRRQAAEPVAAAGVEKEPTRERSPGGAFQRRPWRLAKLLILVGLLGGVYVAYQRFDPSRDSVPATPSTPGNSPLSKENLKTIRASLQAAETAIKNQKYGEARKQIERVLTVAPGHLPALKMRASMNRQKAMEKQREMGEAKARAKRLGVVKDAPGVWSKAETAERQAETYFAAGDFEEAADAWAGASEMYVQAVAVAADRAEVSRLTASFKALKATCEGAEVSDPCQALARQAEEWAAAAEILSRQGDWEQAKLKWRQAVDAQSRVSPPAAADNNKRRYADLMAKAESFADVFDWNSARNVYTAALGVPGYERDALALRGVSRAAKGLLIQKMKQAAAAGRWRDAKKVAADLVIMEPNNPAAAAMIKQAQKQLTVALTIRAVYGGSVVKGAQAIIAGKSSVKDLSQPISLEIDGDYSIRVWAPPRGETYFDTSKTLYKAREAGDDTLVVPLKSVGAPEKMAAWRVPSVGLDMVYMKPGTFDMGSRIKPDEQPLHKVTLTYYFWMAATEITNHHYRTFLSASKYDGKNSANQNYLKHFRGASGMSAGAHYPMCYVSWQNAMAFCEWLTNREREGKRLPEGYVYRLPTEAEWEYCARYGGSPEEDAALTARAWYRMNAQANQPVGQLRANAAGIKDMLGNVWEFCYDYYDKSYYAAGEITDPVGPKVGPFRVMRGGSYMNPAELCRPGYRSSVSWKDAQANVGFRIVLAPSIQALRE